MKYLSGLGVIAAGVVVGAVPVAAQDLPACERYPEGETSYQCQCDAGAMTGSVWGEGPYTGDSSLCAAAQHAGVVDANGGAILALARPGLDDYPSSDQNGISTRAWGSYRFSVELRRVKGQSASAVADCAGFPADATYVECACPAGDFDGSVWGSDPYTADSDICAAARHVGYVTEDGGIARAIKIQGLESYLGTTDNGVETSNWGSYTDSFVFDWNFE